MQKVSPRVAASLITLLSLAIVIGSVMWLGFGIIREIVANASDDEAARVPTLSVSARQSAF